MFLAMLFFLINSAHPMVMVSIPAGVIVNESKAIVHGAVQSSSCERISGIIYTDYTFKISDTGYIKANIISSDTVNIKVLGGKIGRESMDMPGFPYLTVGGEYVLFLEKRGNDYDIYGANQGCMRVVPDPAGNKNVIPCESEYYNMIYVDQSVSGAVRLDSFIKKVQGYQKN
ncbi:MAG: hypothetical protein WCQ53_04210 [bacterium]